MTNKVVYTLAKAFNEAGAPAVQIQLSRRGREHGQL